MTRRLFAAGLLVVAACVGAAQAEDRSPGINCSTSGNFTNCNVTGEGTFDTVVAAVKLLAQQPASENQAIVERLKREKDKLPPPFLYELSRRVFSSDPQESAYYFFLASVRSRYDGGRCRDRSAAQGTQMVILNLQPLLKPVAEQFQKQPALVNRAFQLIKDRDEMFAGQASPWWICSHGMAAIVAATSGKPMRSEDWLKPESEWAQVQTDLRTAIDTTIAKHKDD